MWTHNSKDSEKDAQMTVARKLRLYFDTTIPNYLFVDDRPAQKMATEQLWNDCMAGKHDVFTSQVLFHEVEKCTEPKRSNMYSKLNSLNLVILEESNKVRNLAHEYIKSGILRERDYNDCLHIAHAVIFGCDIVLSWNFEHMVNASIRKNIKIINATARYNEIEIVSPSEFLKGGHYGD
jgi:predicted nucleic acid-binding protein